MCMCVSIVCEAVSIYVCEYFFCESVCMCVSMINLVSMYMCKYAYLPWRLLNLLATPPWLAGINLSWCLITVECCMYVCDYAHSEVLYVCV